MQINPNAPEEKPVLQVESLNTAEKEFVTEYALSDPVKLMLQSQRYRHLDIPKLVHYIQARQKVKQKLPHWHQNLDIVYPPALSLEQSSSEITAAFKANLVAGDILIDLTGGFGIDSFFFAQQSKAVMYVERNPELTAVAAHNAQVLNAPNISFQNAEAADFLKDYTGIATWIYLDPARRDTQNRKVHLLQDCEPDVLGLLPLLLTKSKNILLKTSPMLDINQAVQELPTVHKIYVVAVENECKEVLYHLTATAGPNPAVETYNLLPDNRAQYFGFAYADEQTAAPGYSLPQTYIYEPNTAILKAGGFKSLAVKCNLYKLHRNSHLYTSLDLVPDFPGRIFSLKAISRYQKKELLNLLPAKKANISVRNFPETVAQIRIKTGIKEGGDIYLFATTDLNQKPVILVCEKAQNG